MPVHAEDTIVVKALAALLIVAVPASYYWLLKVRLTGGSLFAAAEPAPARWTLTDVAAVLVTFILLTAAFGIMFRSRSLERYLSVDSALKLLMVCVMMKMIQVRGQAAREALGLGLRGLGRHMVSGLAAFFVFLPVLVAALLLWQWTLFRLHGPGYDRTQELVEELLTTRSVSLVTQIAIAAVLVAPVAEELFFRGFLYGVLRSRVRPALAMVVVGLLFGLSHSPAAVSVPMALLGVFLCYVYEKTGRITVPIAIHFLFNLSQTAIMISYRSPG